jgi:hypothetical protein
MRYAVNKMIIEFYPSSKDVELVVQPPQPARTAIPDWYKLTPAYEGLKEISFDDSGAVSNKGLKHCMPFLDALSTGYVQKTWCDIHIEPSPNGQATYRYADGPKLLGHRDNPNVRITEAYYPMEFVWSMAWLPKVPKGYSVLITHPLNRLDLPFKTLSGVIDADGFYHTPFGSVPFYVEKDFHGFIPAGTPMYQIIPIKRDAWTREIHKFNVDESRKRNSIVQKHFVGAYKNLFWSRKDYF